MEVELATIIKKGTNPSAFQLSKRVLVLEPDVITVVSEEEMAELKHKWWGFIGPRVITEKNPLGCFIIRERSLGYVDGMNKEVGKVEDGSTPLDGEKIKKKRKKK